MESSRAGDGGKVNGSVPILPWAGLAARGRWTDDEQSVWITMILLYRAGKRRTDDGYCAHLVCIDTIDAVFSGHCGDNTNDSHWEDTGAMALRVTIA